MSKRDPENMEAALHVIETYKYAGLRTGLYSRGYALLIAGWAGAMTASIAQGNGLWFLLLFGGLMGHYFWKQNQGASVKEIHSLRELGLVLAFASLVVLMAIGGFLGHVEGYRWAAYAAGLSVATLLFGLMELTHGAQWSSQEVKSL